MAAKAGARNHNAKLTAAKVRRIRNAYATGNYSLADLAKKHGVSPQNVWAVVNRRSWKQVD